jgi:hypothetical protein
MQSMLNPPLSNVQLELLKAFSHQLTEHDLAELRKLLAMFFAQRLIQQANQAWDEKGWKDEDVENMLQTKMRKRG